MFYSMEMESHSAICTKLTFVQVKKYEYKGIKSVCVYGGGSFNEQLKSLERGKALSLIKRNLGHSQTLLSFIFPTDATFGKHEALTSSCLSTEQVLAASLHCF